MATNLVTKELLTALLKLIANDIKANTGKIEENTQKFADYSTTAQMNTAIENAITELGLEAYKTEVTNAINKAIDDLNIEEYEKTTVVDGKLALKADKTQVAIDIANAIDGLNIEEYEKTTVVDGKLELKADKTDLNGLATEDFVEEAIADLVDSAPDAMNTLNELANAINNNKGIYDAYVTEHNQAMASLKKELQDEIDADVKVATDAHAVDKKALEDAIVLKADAEDVYTKEEVYTKGEVDAEVKEVQDAVDGILADYLKAEDIANMATDGELAEVNTAIDNRLKVLEAIKHEEFAKASEVEATYETKENVAKVKEDLQAEIDADVLVVSNKLASDKAELEGKINGKVAQADYDVKVKALDDKDAELTQAIAGIDNHSHGNKAVIDGITAEMVAKWENGSANGHTHEIANINGLQNALDGKADDGDVTALETAMNTELAKKVDKVDGKGLSANDFTDELLTKLNNIEAGANKYEHPETHPATMIVQDATHKFVTDEQIALFHTHANQTVLNGITEVKVNAWDGKAEVSDVEAVQDNVDALAETVGTNTTNIGTVTAQANQNKTDITNLTSVTNTIQTNKAEKTYVDQELAKKADAGHNHDDVYMKIADYTMIGEAEASQLWADAMANA